MKRDLDLVRTILKEIEDEVPPNRTADNIKIDGYDQDTVYAHVKLLIDEEYLEGKVLMAMMGIVGVHISGLTWKGHDFVSATKDESLWDKAKKSILKPTASMTVDVLLQWLKAEIRAKVGLP